MRIVNELWQDECGLILSAEAVTVGTLGVLGAVVGLNMASTAVDEELQDFAFAIRSLDQSYCYPGHQSCRAWSAGSAYRQQDVQVSLNDLCADGTADVRAIEEQIDAQRKSRASQPKPKLIDENGVIPVTPNQIPVPELKVDKSESDSKPVEKRKVPDKKAPSKKSDRDDD